MFTPGYGLPDVGVSSAFRNQVPQTAVDISPPAVYADIVAFILGNQADMSEADFRFVTFSGYFKADFCPLPLAWVLRETEVVVQHLPNDFLVGNELNDLHSATVDVLVMIAELGTEPVGVTINLSRPPTTDVIDGLEDFCRSLVYREAGSVVFVIHFLILL